MKISTKGRYGLRAMEVLKDNYGGKPVSISSIAKEQDISVPYLEQLFTKMRKAGIVESVRGAHGGYVLSRPPEEITIGEILNSLEGDIQFDCCDGVSPTCGIEEEPCRTHYILKTIEEGIEEITSQMTLANM